MRRDHRRNSKGNGLRLGLGLCGGLWLGGVGLLGLGANTTEDIRSLAILCIRLELLKPDRLGKGGWSRGRLDRGGEHGLRSLWLRRWWWWSLNGANGASGDRVGRCRRRCGGAALSCDGHAMSPSPLNSRPRGSRAAVGVAAGWTRAQLARSLGCLGTVQGTQGLELASVSFCDLKLGLMHQCLMGVVWGWWDKGREVV